MAELLESLRKLQDIDTDLLRLRSEEERKPEELERAREAVTHEQERAKAIEAKVQGFQVQQKEKELELSTHESGVKKHQVQLLQVKTNKEYTAMQQEIDQAKADISLLEEEILTLLEMVDQTKREHQVQVGLVQQQEQALRGEEAKVERELDVIRQEIEQSQKERDVVVPGIDPNTLSLYEQLLAAREGLAMVPLMNESCGGCNMLQPPQVVSEARLKGKLATCDSCHRILYVDDSQDG